MERFAGRTAVVIGAGSGGIGTGIARACAAADMSVVVADIDGEGAAQVAAAIIDSGARAVGRAVDALDPASLESLAEFARREFGSVDLLSSNVGVVLSAPLTETTGDQWSWLLELNVMSVVRSVDAFLPALRSVGGDTHIAFTSSMAGLMRPDLEGMPLGVYAATKHALIGYGDSLRSELAPEGIGVTVLCPGPVATNLTATSAKHRPDRFGGSYEDDTPMPPGQDPDHAGDVLLRAIAGNRFLALTHPELQRFVERRYRGFAEDFSFAMEGATDGP